MIDDLKFVQGAVAKKDYVAALTHFNIRDGRIKGYNGSLALCSPIALNLDVQPKATQLVKAIQTCKGSVQINMTPNGRLSIKSGKFRAHVDCIEEEFPDVEPEGEMVELDGHLLDAIKILNPFIAEDASRPWARGILLNGHSAFATNNIILVEYWLGYTFPYVVNLPKPAVQELLRIGEEPERLQIAAGNVTFHYKGERWLRTQVYTTEWPDLAKVLDRECNPKPIDSSFFEALDDLAPFLGDIEQVYFTEKGMTTSREENTGASVEYSGLEAGTTFNLKQLQLLDGVATKIDLSQYPKPCIFYGNKIRGAIAGMQG